MSWFPQLAAILGAAIAMAAASAILRFIRKSTRSIAPRPQSTSVALDKRQLKAFKLIEKTVASHDTRIFRFALESSNQRLGLPVGQHLAVRAIINGEPVQRSYTPISCDDDKGYFDLMIKVYFPNVHPSFPAGGKMSMFFEKLNIGDTITVRGPLGRFAYLGHGRYTIQQLQGPSIDRTVKHMSMCAGGTGITPVLQIIRQIVRDPTDRTRISLLFANQTIDDILLRDELDACGKDERIKVWYTLDRPPEGWKYGSGFISKAMVEEHLFPAGDDVVALMCGPPPMIERACKPNLAAIGYRADQMFVF